MQRAFLVVQHAYTLDELINISGGGDRLGRGGDKSQQLHKQSAVRILDLRVGYTLARGPSDARSRTRDNRHRIRLLK